MILLLSFSLWSTGLLSSPWLKRSRPAFLKSQTNFLKLEQNHQSLGGVLAHSLDLSPLVYGGHETRLFQGSLFLILALRSAETLLSL